MAVETFKKGERVVGYIAGGTLTVLGLMGLMIELAKEMPSPKNFSGHVIAAVLVGCGLVTCIVVWSRYRGGWWSLLGLLLVATATIRVVVAAEAYIRGRHLVSPVAFISTTAAVWVAGCYCLFWGYIRRPRQEVKS